MIEQSYRIERRPLIELGSIATEWQSLADRALAPNVFLEPAFVLAAAPVLGRKVDVDLVWSRQIPGIPGNPEKLVGFFPSRIERRRYGLAPPILTAWTHPFAPLGTPLVDRDVGATAVSAWFSFLESRADLPKLLLMPFLPASGPAAGALADALAQHGGASRCFAVHQRALLAPAASRSDYLVQAIGGKKRKELRRQRNRLAETGVLVSETVSKPAAVAAALGDFLALEASGWKGRAGTAARDDQAIRAFMEQAVIGLAQIGKARITRLTLDDRPIAALVTLQSGATAWCWKIAYDETFSRFSPGVLLLLDATQNLLDDPTIACVDSCATAGHPMIDHIWRERLDVAEQLIRLGPHRSFAVACTLEQARRAAIAGLKRWRDAVKR
jgi:CelD/BcsL family acetyltransferase involved in cellulose biosynthesis